MHRSFPHRLRFLGGTLTKALLRLGFFLGALALRGQSQSLEAPRSFFEQLYLEQVAVWPDFRRGPAEIVRQGNRWTLVGSARRGFHVLDLTNPAQPTRVASVDSSGLNVADLWSTNDLAFVATSAELRAYDLSVPAAPYLLDTTQVRQLDPILLGIGEHYLCTLYDGGVQIIDYANPADLLSSYATSKLGGKCLAVDGDLVFVGTAGSRAANAKLMVFEFTPPRQLEPRSELTLGTTFDEHVGALRVDAGRLYARLDRFTSALRFESRLVSVDVRDPSHPVLLGDVKDLPRTSIAVSGSTLALADQARGLLLADARRSDQLIPLTTLPSRDRAMDIQLSTDQGLVAESQAGLQILDLHQPALPVRQAAVDLGGFSSDLLRVSNALYVADHGGGLRVFDVSTPTNPIPLQRVFLDGRVFSVQRTASTLSALTLPAPREYEDPTNSTFCLLDITEPFFPRLRGKLQFPNLLQGQRALGDLVYLAADRAGIIVIDVRDPANPVEVGRQDTFGEARNLEVIAGRAYVADGTQGVQIYDVSDPRKFRRLGGFQTTEHAQQIRVSGHHAFVVTGRDGIATLSGRVEIVDVTDPGHPTLVSSLGFQGPRGCTIAGDLAFVGFEGRLALYNISRITDPKILGTVVFSNEDAASVVDVNGRTVTLAMGDAGLRFFQLKGRTEQHLHLDVPPIVSLGRTPTLVVASSSSRLPVNVSVIDGPARLNEGQLIATNYGPVTLRAEQPGNDDYFGTRLDVTVQVRVPIRVVQNGGELEVFWPVAASGLHLQRTPVLNPEAHWVDLDAPVEVSGNEFHVRIPLEATSALLRLSR